MHADDASSVFVRCASAMDEQCPRHARHHPTDSDTVSNRTWGNALASVLGERSPYLDGGRIEQRDVFTDGAPSVAGMDRTGVSAPPARARDPYTDGARAGDMSLTA